MQLLHNFQVLLSLVTKVFDAKSPDHTLHHLLESYVNIYVLDVEKPFLSAPICPRNGRLALNELWTRN